MIYWKNELLDLHPIAHWTERGFSLKRDLLFLTILACDVTHATNVLNIYVHEKEFSTILKIELN